MVRPDAAIQQHPHDLGAARQRGRLHNRGGVRRTQQIRRLRQRRAEPGDIATVSQIPRPRHATGALAAPGHLPRAVPRFFSASHLPARGYLFGDESQG